MAVKMRIKTLFPVLKRITEDTNVDCFDWLMFWLHGPGEYVFFTIRSRSNVHRLLCKQELKRSFLGKFFVFVWYFD